MGRDCAAAATTLRKLNAIKVGLAMDDFGTGAGSVRYVREFPIDRITIHRPFVKTLGMANNSSGVVTSMFKLVQSLAITATAQRMETEVLREMLMAHGCSDGQAYYFSRPVDGATATGLITESRRNQQKTLSELQQCPRRIFGC